MRKATLAGVINFCNVGGISANVLPLGAGGDFETQINQVNSKHQRTSQRNVARKPRLRKTAVGLCAFINYVSNFA
jgi:hypothetical protein